MQFSSNSSQLIGGELEVRPYEGYGWCMAVSESHVNQLSVPGGFNVTVLDVLTDQGEVRALLGKVAIRWAGRKYDWISLIPRTDDVIDLRQRDIGCNLLICTSRPAISRVHPYPHPEHVWCDAFPQIRGFGQVGCLDRTGKQDQSSK